MSLHAEAARIAELLAHDAVRAGDHSTAARWWLVAVDNWAAHGAAVPEERSAARLAQSRCWRRIAEAADRAADAEEREPGPTQPGGVA